MDSLIFTLAPVTILNVAILWMPAMQCSTKQWLCLVTIVSQSKVLEVPSLCLVFVNKCPCEIIWTVASIPIICITFSENLTQFSMIVNPTIKSLLFSECRSHKNTYKTPYDKYRSRPEKYILNRRVLNLEYHLHHVGHIYFPTFTFA